MSRILTVGLPVYNGAAYLVQALDAVLGQTYGDFRFLISDNASTDATPEILARYARADRRIEVVRQPENIGGIGNFQYLVERTETPYLMFAAHDDVFAPTAVEKCLAGLLARPSAVMCCADLAFIHAAGDPTRSVTNLDTTGMDLPARANALLTRFGWYAVYGVARRDAVAATMPYTGRYGGDVVQTMEMLLLGEIIAVRETLFHYRVPESLGRTAAEQQLAIDHTTPVVRRPYSTILIDLVARVERATVTAADRARVVETAIRTIAFENEAFYRQIALENALQLDEDDPVAVLGAVRAIARSDPKA